MSKPWECPVCHRGCAPDVKTCDHGGAKTIDIDDLKRRIKDPLPKPSRLPADIPYPYPWRLWPDPFYVRETYTTDHTGPLDNIAYGSPWNGIPGQGSWDSDISCTKTRLIPDA